MHHATTTPPHFYCFPSTTTTFLSFVFTPPPQHFHCFHSTTTTFLSFSLHHHHISIVFPRPPPHFYRFHSTTTTFLLFSLHQHHISIVFSPPIVFLPDRPTQANLRPERSNSNIFSSRKTIGEVKTIEMWWRWWRETIEMWWWLYIVSLFTKLC